MQLILGITLVLMATLLLSACGGEPTVVISELVLTPFSARGGGSSDRATDPPPPTATATVERTHTLPPPVPSGRTEAQVIGMVDGGTINVLVGNQEYAVRYGSMLRRRRTPMGRALAERRKLPA